MTWLLMSSRAQRRIRLCRAHQRVPCSMLTAGATPMSESQFDRGMKVRREVLGDGHVDRAERRATDLDRDFQRFITEMAWGGVWASPDLDRRTRSLVTIAILAALGREE